MSNLINQYSHVTMINLVSRLKMQENLLSLHLVKQL